MARLLMRTAAFAPQPFGPVIYDFVDTSCGSNTDSRAARGALRESGQTSEKPKRPRAVGQVVWQTESRRSGFLRFWDWSRSAAIRGRRGIRLMRLWYPNRADSLAGAA